MRLWIAASVTRHDLWTVDLRTCPGGDFIFVVESADVLASTSAAMQSRHCVSRMRGEGEGGGGGMMMKKTLLNYFSFGYESKVGMEFDKHRTGDAQMNQLVYGFRGIWEAGKAQVHTHKQIRNRHTHTTCTYARPHAHTRTHVHQRTQDRKSVV